MIIYPMSNDTQGHIIKGNCRLGLYEPVADNLKALPHTIAALNLSEYFLLAINERKCLQKVKVKSCYNPLRLGTVIVLISSGIDFVNTPRLYSDRATR